MNNSQLSALSRARDAWGRALPDWVEALARECDRATQRAVALRVGYSAAVINQVLANSYRGSLEKVERAVRVEFFPDAVACPVLGAIDEKLCLAHRTRPSFANHVLAELARACPRCPNALSVIKTERSPS